MYLFKLHFISYICYIFLLKIKLILSFFFHSVYYASGCSIARFPEDGIVIAKNLKDQGASTPLRVFNLV